MVVRNVGSALLVSCLAIASAGASGPASTPRTATPKVAAQLAKTDIEIEKDIRARLARSKISPDKFQVHVQGGVATLEGKTDIIQHKGVATRLAKNAGAVAVVNHIEISQAARAKAAKNLETGRRRAQIKRGEPRSETAPARPYR